MGGGGGGGSREGLSRQTQLLIILTGKFDLLGLQLAFIIHFVAYSISSVAETRDSPPA